MDERMDERQRPAAEQDWSGLSADVCSGMRDWQVQHPYATWREIEGELDERLCRLRARMLEDLVQQRAAADWSNAQVKERPRCRTCHELLHARGKHTRHLTTHGGRKLTVEREYGVCPQCGHGLFPPR